MSKVIPPFIFGAIMSYLICWASLGLVFLGVGGAGGSLDTAWAVWVTLAVNAVVVFGIIAGAPVLAFRSNVSNRPLLLGAAAGAVMWAAGFVAWFLALLLQ